MSCSDYVAETCAVLILLLRLRQVCSHPSLIQESAHAFVDPKYLEDKHYDLRYELQRARQLVSPQFVEQMQNHFKRVIVERMEAEKQVSAHRTSPFLHG